MTIYGKGKPLKWEEKSLIEWEKENGIWIPELFLEDHFVMYNKMEAFDKLREYKNKVGCDWNSNSDKLYDSFICYDKNINVSSAIIRDYIDKIDFFSRVSRDTSKKSLIEWEESVGLFVSNKPAEFHYKRMVKEEAFDIIADSCFCKLWDNESTNVYSKYMRKSGNSMHANLSDNPVLRLGSGNNQLNEDYVIDGVPVKKFISGSVVNLENDIQSIYIKEDGDFNTYGDNEYVDTVLEPVNNAEKKKIYNFLNISAEIDTGVYDGLKENNVSNSFMEVDVESKKKNVFDIFNTKKPKNKANIKKSIIKATLAIVASITTLVSVRATSNLNYKNEDIVDNSYSYIQNSEISESSNPVFVQEDKNDNKSIDTNSEKVNVGNKKDTIDEIDDNVKIEIGDIVTIEENASIYISLDDAYKMQNGLNLENDNEMLRKVEYIAVNYNDSIVYSNKQDEIDYYIDNGGNEVAVMTSVNDYDNIGIEGSYNIKNVIKYDQKVKKLS